MTDTLPRPPASIFDQIEETFIPAMDMQDFVLRQIVAEAGKIHNQDHAHLEQAHLGFLWTNAEAKRRGKFILGQAEEAKFLCAKWQKGRQEQQMREWFGVVPDFVITLNANYCNECSDADLLALIEHELYHCGQKTDQFGAPKFSDDGRPMFEIKGHDVEEFTGVIRRYGMGNNEALREMVQFAQQSPEVSQASIASVCGTCRR